MSSLTMKISELKNNLIDINLKAIKKSKAKPIKNNSKNHDEKYLYDYYNYYVKLTKRLKRHIEINKDKEIILKMIEDKHKRIICIAIDIDKRKIDIGISIVMNIITGNDCNTFMDCTYFNTCKGGNMYINDFRSSKPRQGYGSIILKNLDNIIDSINKILVVNGYEEILTLEGVMIPNTKIISKKDLKKLYMKYDFLIEDNNRIKRYMGKQVMLTYNV